MTTAKDLLDKFEGKGQFKAYVHSNKEIFPKGFTKFIEGSTVYELLDQLESSELWASKCEGLVTPGDINPIGFYLVDMHSRNNFYTGPQKSSDDCREIFEKSGLKSASIGEVRSGRDALVLGRFGIVKNLKID